jgi:hypothetical protein
LSPERSAEIVNFGNDRGTKERDVVIEAKKALPKSLTPKQIGLDVPRRFERASETLESSDLAYPTFTEPVISSDRTEIRFTACINGDGADAGRYVGAIRVGGPIGLEPATVAVTANMKAASETFWAALVASLVLALVLLLFRRQRDPDEKIDGGFVAQVVFPLGAAGLAMYGVYANDPAWGADEFTAVIGLAGTALGAAGLKSLFDAQAGRRS